MSGGFAARHGLDGAARRKAAREVLARVKADGIETVRISFADQHGVLRGKTLVPEALKGALDNGVAMTSTLLLKDTSHRTVFPVWSADSGFGEGRLTGAGDFIILPDPSTFKALPWSPHSGWMLCDLYHADGAPIGFSSRAILRDADARLGKRGLAFTCGLEVEFHVYRLDDPKLAHEDGGMPATPPQTSLLTHGYQYLTEGRYDVVEDVMDAIRRACEALDLPVRSMEIEFGPSQFEFTFAPGAALAQADALILFRAAVQQVCRRIGLHATFMSRPRVEHGMASGWHVHQSLSEAKGGAPLFMPDKDGQVTETAGAWIAGILEHAAASCLLTTPTVNGYKRYQPFLLAPDRIQWSRDNKGAMIRALMAPGDRASRIENRVPESAANPYLCLASQILSGLDGLERAIEAPPPAGTPYDADAPALPRNLGAALDAFQASGFYRRALGEETVRYLACIKRAEWDRYLATVSEWEQREYFTLF